MLTPLTWIVVSTVAVSVLSFIGILTLILKDKLLDKILFLLVSFSAGALMGNAFLHLIPEAAEIESAVDPFLLVLVGFSAFFLIGRVLHWHHYHHGKKHVHEFAYLNLVGEAVHNFMDGMVLAAAFIVDVRLGLMTTLAVILHEIPQELGDFGVLVYGGFSKAKAFLWNFIAALTAVLGGLVGYFLSTAREAFAQWLLPIAAGGFIYVAASDLVPELKKAIRFRVAMRYFFFFLLGIALMYGATFIEQA